MANLNVTVTVSEGKKKEDKKLTSFAIGESIVRTELSGMNKEARQAKVREFAKRFLTPEQQGLDFVCTVTSDEPAQAAPTAEAAPEATPTPEVEISHCE